MTEIDEQVLDQLPPEVRRAYESQVNELATLRAQLETGRRSRMRGKSSPAELIERARTRRDVKGRNRAAVEFANRHPDLRKAMARAVADMPGVTVDETKFRLAPTSVQTVLRLYNLPEVQRAGEKYRPPRQAVTVG